MVYKGTLNQAELTASLLKKILNSLLRFLSQSGLYTTPQFESEHKDFSLSRQTSDYNLTCQAPQAKQSHSDGIAGCLEVERHKQGVPLALSLLCSLC